MSCYTRWAFICGCITC